MSLFPVGRITSGVQAAGHWSGTPAGIVHILADPASLWIVECAAASTRFEDKDDYPDVAYSHMERPLTDLLRQRMTPGQFSRVGDETLAGLLKSLRPHHVVLTGPDPLDYDLARLLKLLKDSGRRVQIETRASVFAEIPPWVWLTLRTAPSQSDTLAFDVRTLRRANEVIAKIFSSKDVDSLDAMLGISQPEAVWIIPARADQRLYSMCVDVAASKRWRVVRPSK